MEDLGNMRAALLNPLLTVQYPFAKTRLKSSSSPKTSHTTHQGLSSLALMATGVVFGDIGTSPLYALKACFDPVNGIALNSESINGVLSVLLWSFLLVITFKYVFTVMRANNHGEGGVLALLALSLSSVKPNSPTARFLMVVGVIGASLFYGDAVITPAISVMSAIEGMTVVSEHFTRFEVPITLVILLGLFVFERRGTSTVGKIFGPIMLMWFLIIAAMGVVQIYEAPEILLAINPWYAWDFMRHDTRIAFMVLGSVFLVLAGAEALYADMGHFGMRAIQLAWMGLVMPSLLLNYFGQGAMMLHHPETASNPFFFMVPKSLTIFLVLLAARTTVIASQACISGAYSMTSQAILLGFLPRMKVHQTSEREIGQIYVPFVNWTLCALVVLVVVVFQKSESLAAAYGIAVSTTMLMTTLLAVVVMQHVWRWRLLNVAIFALVFVSIDVLMFASNLVKVAKGGWVTLLLGLVCFIAMFTWYQGRQLLRAHHLREGLPLEEFMNNLLLKNPPHRIPGTAVFLSAQTQQVPFALLQNLKHNHILHEQVIFLKLSVWNVPWVEHHKRLRVKQLNPSMYQVRAVYGFKETPDTQEVIRLLKEQFDIECPPDDTSFFIASESLGHELDSQMPHWRRSLFNAMMHNATRTSDFFKIDVERVIELGTKVDLK